MHRMLAANLLDLSSRGLDLALRSAVAQGKVAGREVVRLGYAFHARGKVEISTALVAGSFC